MAPVLDLGQGAMVDDDKIVPIDPDLAPGDPAEPAIGRPRGRRAARRRRAEPDVVAVIMLGGMCGASARYAMTRMIPVESGAFPWAIFWVNVSGSFLLGLLLVLVLERFPPSRLLRPFLATGVLGAYTTMSTFLVDTTVLVKDEHVATAVSYAVGSIVAGLAAAYFGVLSGRLTPPRHKEART
jgi:CrcB protein